MLQFADKAGFWCYHKAEHHFIHLDAAPSANVFLAAASQRTEHIRLGSLVYLLPFYEPIRLIEEICALDHLSGGRLEIGVGKGISPAEHMLWGRPPEEARARFEEAFDILRLGLAADSLTYEGPNFRFEDAPLPMRPYQRPQPGIWYPGNFDYAGRHRLSTIVGGPTSLVANAAKSYAALIASPDVDWNPGVSQPTIGATRHLFIASTTEAALARVQTAWPAYHKHLAKLFKQHDIPFAPPGDPSFDGDVNAALAFEGLLAGSPDDVATHLENLHEETGINYAIGAFAWGDLSHAEAMSSMRLFAKEVMPRFTAGD
jgi:alkanesulfonate monooxygenase SsuD/methylene tetrahydromethanopterin reductase-like flavin-dependent oxidoreductase (luciferase family)